jgi:hypothetical protein
MDFSATSDSVSAVFLRRGSLSTEKFRNQQQYGKCVRYGRNNVIVTSGTASRRTYCNIPTAEFGMISAEIACWYIERK